MSIRLEAGDLKRQDVSLTPLPVEEYPFTYKDLETSAPVIVGYPVTISCRVMLCISPVGRPITHPVTLYINNTPVLSQDVTLTRSFLCAETRVEFQFTPGSTRTYQVEIGGLIGSFTATTEVFVNTPLELVKSALEFPDEVTEAYLFSEPFLSGLSELKDTHFTFDHTIVQPDLEPYEPSQTHPSCIEGYHREYSPFTPHWMCVPDVIPNANLNCVIGLDLGGYSGWNLSATLIAVKASEYQSWLNGIRFIDWGHPGRLGTGVYGLGFPLEQSGLIPLDSQGYPSRASICGRDYDCKYIHHEESCGSWTGCTLRSGDHEFNVNGLLALEPGSWIVLASFVLSICNIYYGYDDRLVVLPLDCYNYKIYKIGTIDF